MSSTRDEVYELKFPEDGSDVIQNGDGPSLNLRNISNKVFEIVGGTGGTFNLALRYSVNGGLSSTEFLAAQSSTTSNAPTAFPAVAEANCEVFVRVSGFSAEGSVRPRIFVVGRREN